MLASPCSFAALCISLLFAPTARDRLTSLFSRLYVSPSLSFSIYVYLPIALPASPLASFFPSFSRLSSLSPSPRSTSYRSCRDEHESPASIDASLPPLLRPLSTRGVASQTRRQPPSNIAAVEAHDDATPSSGLADCRSGTPQPRGDLRLELRSFRDTFLPPAATRSCDLTARFASTVARRRDVCVAPLLIGPCKDIDYRRGEMR